MGGFFIVKAIQDAAGDRPVSKPADVEYEGTQREVDEEDGVPGDNGI